MLIFYMESKMFRIMALDYGTVRIGIALSDLTQIIANGYENYQRTSLKNDLNHLKQIINENKVGKIVVGLPLNMDGSESSQTLKTKEFIEILRNEIPNIPIEVLDERLTSMVAEKLLISADISRAKRKQVIDKMSATIILQDYLDRQN